MWHPEIPEEYRNQIVTGDARALAERLPDESIDLIFTDPPWNNPSTFQTIATIANDKLKPGAFLLSYTGMMNLPQALNDFSNLVYKAVFCIHIHGDVHNSWANRTFERWQPIVWFSKGPPQWPNGHLIDTVVKGKKSKINHPWEQAIEPALYYIRTLTQSQATVLDLFAGSGTTAAACKILRRNYIAFEIDPDTAETAREE